MISRRDLLHATAGLALAGCGARRVPVAALPDGPATLGWRWVPGSTLVYRTVTRRVSGRVVHSRAEAWRYLVMSLDERNVATLEGRLAGFGAGIEVEGEPVPASRLDGLRAQEEMRTAQPVQLQIGMDGRLVSCSATGFAPGLPHRMLALRVPQTPISVHDEWTDPAIARPFAALLPVDVEVAVQGTARLLEWFHHEHAVTAALEVTGQIETVAHGPRMVLVGSAWWNAERGVLSRRTLDVSVDPPAADPDAGPGRLTLSTELV